ncbi:hypothetical protein SDC9_205359 [bioreactor metagenome]|uniref:Uncharacterized protein n=1 Tax=bioreactor metagenome TaxID=1076179 RepID=A0A645J1V1_9ZZZZ
MLDDAEGHLDQVAGLVLAVMQHALANLEQRNQAEDEQADQHQATEDVHARGDAQFCQAAHF